jgi:hypothetical protein
MAARRFSQRQKRLRAWLAADARRTGGVMVRSHPELVVALQQDKGHRSPRLRPLEARGGLVIGRSRGGHAASLDLTSEGQTWAAQFEGSCDEAEAQEQARAGSPRPHPHRRVLGGLRDSSRGRGHAG